MDRIEGEFDSKQDVLVSGENIKTINDESILGDGNIDILSEVSWGDIEGVIDDQTDLKNALDSKQDTLVSGTNIKTINNTSLLGSGDISISPGASEWGDITGTLSDQTDLQNALNDKLPATYNALLSKYSVNDLVDFNSYIFFTSGVSFTDFNPPLCDSDPTLNKHLTRKSYVDNLFAGTELYNNPSGTNTDFTLSDSITNYKTIKITYTDNNGDCFRIVELPTSNCFDNLSIYGCYQDTNGTHMVIRNSFIDFSGTNATWTASRCCYMDITSNTQNVQSGNYIYIRKVVGYK
jgi:hypothetical protein